MHVLLQQSLVNPTEEPPRTCRTLDDLEPAISACEECFQNAVDLLVRDKVMGGLSLALLQHHISPEHFDSVLNMLTNRHEQLKTRELRILLAGESAAGKTTFMNVLMGGKYLPIGYGPETKTVCELRYRTNRWAKLVFKSIPSLNQQIGIGGESLENLSSEILQLSEDADDISWNHLVEVIRTASRDYNGVQRHVEKVELYWPLEFIKHLEEAAIKQHYDEEHLEEAAIKQHYDEEISEEYTNSTFFPVVLIDCPGITDDESSFGLVLENAKTCHGFIFVVNVSSAYGVERNKVT
ncbi:hypothetical protein CHS0354_019315 [Potamilus streckersoni]|uniref:Dynamin N-terminal domain-containing protein n=1 Tax=Potamilus streckersoni TaxID=2493646 RepID=A0AAE0SHK8_9BIVA|nr:hypothetical protein CHS0354_019315 [Potamilus streckersoni]